MREISTRFGVTWWHSSIAIGQRSRNRQPGLGSTTFGGSPAVMDDVTASGERGSGTAATGAVLFAAGWALLGAAFAVVASGVFALSRRFA